MKTLILCLLVLFTKTNCYAQNGYHVVYQSSLDFFGEKHSTFYHLVFNDSIAYSYITNDKSNFKSAYKLTDSVYGDFADHHNSFYLQNQQKSLWVARLSKRKIILKEKPREVYNYTVLQDSLHVNGLDCQSGYALKASGDTIYAIIAKNIKKPYGPFAYCGLPGLVVEIWDTEYKFHTSMVNIFPGNYFIKIPAFPIKPLKSSRKEGS